ncbi:MAG: CopD family protein [Chitinophagales bacterium]
MTAYYISVFMHVVFAAFWIGSMLTLPLVILPSLKNHPERVKLLYASGLKLRFWGWIALGGLLITGLLNIHLRGLPINWQLFTANKYGVLVSYKILIFIAIILVGAVHDFYIGGKALEEMETTQNETVKKIARYSGRLMLLLALSAAFIGVAASRGGF